MPNQPTAAGAPASLVPPPASPAAKADRLDHVDLLRGLVMILMALDHTRDFVHWGELHGFNPLDLKTTTVPLFLTRWITHYCAPVFIFLAGTGAFLSGTRGKSKRELSWFLVTRGAWLILLELTVIHWFGWSFSISLHDYLGFVIWAIGWSMIALAALIHLPLAAVATIGIAMIVGHNALDRISAGSWGSFAWLWQILHTGGPIEFAKGYTIYIGYPLVPWIGVMAAGYAFGRVLQRPREERRRVVLWLGVALTFAFVALRLGNLYGNPKPWTSQSSPIFTALGLLDCAKYPPSLCYLLMTLGPALILLALLDRETTPPALKPALVFGRVPLFYYLLHIPLVHGVGVALEAIRSGTMPGWLIGDYGERAPMPDDAGFGLAVVYATWIAAVAILYPLCAWFAALKKRRRDAWLSYL